MNKTKKLLWIGFLALHLAIIGFYWWQGSGSLFGTDGNNAMIALGRLAGLLAGLTVLLQFLFMGRMPWLERVFGLDKLAKVHKLNGKLTLLFILTHPLLLSLGYAGASGINVVDQYMSFVFDYEHVWMAAIALWLFVFVVISSIYIVRSRVKFESWYFVHLAVYVAFFMSYFHQAEVGTDLIVSKVFAIYWIALYATVFGMHVVFRFGVPLYNFFRHGFVVDKVVRETGSAVSIYIKGKAMDRFKVDPGQFMIFRFLAKGLWWQAHPFSLSMVPDGRQIRITVKEVGDFTQMLKDLKPGTKIMIEGPYGVFTDFFGIADRVLLVAGGIGITPIRSLSEQLAKAGKNVEVLYGNRTREDIVFWEELNDLAASMENVRLTHVMSQDESFEGEQGRIDAEKIERLVPDVAQREVYVCGPIPMMEAVVQAVKSLGVAPERVHYEKFEL